MRLNPTITQSEKRTEAARAPQARVVDAGRDTALVGGEAAAHTPRLIWEGLRMGRQSMDGTNRKIERPSLSLAEFAGTCNACRATVSSDAEKSPIRRSGLTGVPSSAD